MSITSSYQSHQLIGNQCFFSSHKWNVVLEWSCPEKHKPKEEDEQGAGQNLSRGPVSAFLQAQPGHQFALKNKVALLKSHWWHVSSFNKILPASQNCHVLLSWPARSLPRGFYFSSLFFFDGLEKGKRGDLKVMWASWLPSKTIVWLAIVSPLCFSQAHLP